MATVGIIANPASGKDIRRLVSYGTVFDNQEKVNIVRRILLGLAAVKVKRIVYMPDYYGIVPKAVDGLKSHDRLSMEIISADINLTGTQLDSYRAAQVMESCKVDCIITLGGDGTNRMVAKGCGSIPLLPVSTGTNNVFPSMVEGTVAGMAAGVVARGIVNHFPVVQPTKKLIVYKNGLPIDIALVDAVVLRDKFIGSRAIWEVNHLVQAVVSRGEPHNIGIASVAGYLKPIGVTDKEGLSIEFGRANYKVLAPIAPGLIVPVEIETFQKIRVNEKVKVKSTPCIIALDGEREVEVNEKDEAYIELTFDGPKVVDVKAALRAAVDGSHGSGMEELHKEFVLQE
ncbi:MAG: acox [Peptococcaceae bacterium]|jgi:predicted polyphosphate/ATP-dependent NAD kinase|nr:acox [Peptococcaceae bacterium]